MTKETLKLALEALEKNTKHLPADFDYHFEAITALKEALAEHAMREVQRLGQEIEQEPKEEKLHPIHIGVDVTKEGTAVTAFYRKPDAVMEMFYSQFHPMAQPEQEPVAWLSTDSIGERYLCFDKPLDNDPVQPLYTTPPQRKPLTNGELYTAYITATNQTLRPQDERLAFAFARAIEAAHSIKENT